jgi:hypothetical protein
MPNFSYPFNFTEDINNPINGELRFETPTPYQDKKGQTGFSRKALLGGKNIQDLELVFYDNPATASFMYLRETIVNGKFLEIVGLSSGKTIKPHKQALPGQLCLGPERSALIGEAMMHIFSSPDVSNVVRKYNQHEIAVFPIAREGLKYQVADSLFTNFGYYCDEVVLDAHHVFDSSVPVYNRVVELTLFKDKDLDQQQKENIKVAYLADSIASGLVMKEVIARVSERFENLERIEVVAPLATIRGLCRLAQAETARRVHLRVHVFETILNALPPDYYYSAHFKESGFHIHPELEEAYRKWWGFDKDGIEIAETACAGYGWSEVFYSPRKQIQMINNQLTARHGLTIADIVKRNFPLD